MTPEEAYEEALRRIREAEETGALELDLSGLKAVEKDVEITRWFWPMEPTGLETLNRLPLELARLTSLQSLDLLGCQKLSGDLSRLASLTSLQTLNLSWCYQLSGDLSPLASLTSLQSLNLSWCWRLCGDLSPLADLTSLQSLNLSWCRQLSSDLSPLAGLTSLQSLDLRLRAAQRRPVPTGWPHLVQSLDLSRCSQLSGDLSPLASLTSLQSLDLSGCRGIRRFAPLKSLLPTLKELSLLDCKLDDLPPEVCGDRYHLTLLGEASRCFAKVSCSELDYGP